MESLGTPTLRRAVGVASPQLVMGLVEPAVCVTAAV
jgi:hypothetical protein